MPETGLGANAQNGLPSSSNTSNTVYPPANPPSSSSSLNILPSQSSHADTYAIKGVHKDMLEMIGPLTAHTWQKWKNSLPKVVGVPLAEYYLDGTMKYKGYTKAEVVELLMDGSRDKEYRTFMTWRTLAQNLKMVLQNYGGTDVAARVDHLEDGLGDTPAIYQKLEEWYGGLGLGTEKASLIFSIYGSSWDESMGDPLVYFNKIETQRLSLNQYYRAEARNMDDKTDPNILALSHAALPEQVLRDVIMTRLPTEYHEALSQQQNYKTSWNEFKNAVISLYSVRKMRTEMEAHRTVAMRVEETKSGSGRNRHRRGKGGNKGGVKKDATEFGNYQSWPFGFFRDRNGKQRFKIERGSCFRCFKPGHLVGKCPLAADSTESANARLEVMNKYNIQVKHEDANALLLVDPNPGCPNDPEVIDTLLAMISVSDENSPTTLERNLLPHPSASFVTIKAPDDLYIDPSVAFRITTSPRGPILDGGASFTFFTVLSQIHGYLPFEEPKKIGGAFSSTGYALGQGYLVLKSDDGKLVVLDQVMYAPKLGVDLISQTRMMMAGFKFTNDTTTLSVFDPSGNHAFNLPVSPTIEIDASRFVPPSSPLLSHASPLSSSHSLPQALVSIPDSLLLEHFRAGHPSDERLKKRIGGNWTEKVSSRCDECARGKATRKGVSRVSDNRATRKMERFSADTWGPSPVKGTRGERYAVLIIDAWSRYAWVEIVTSKGGIEELVKQRIKREERSEGLKVAAFQSDNGTEFVNRNLDSWLAKEGIQHRLTVPYVHNQNGLVEVRWRHLLEITRTLLLTSKLSPSFWPYALQTAVYLYNHTASSALNFDTPAHRYYNVDSSKVELRVWGCTAWLSLPREGSYRVNKLGARAVKGRFLGYAEDRKGWKFWVPEWRKVVVWVEVERWDEFSFGSDGMEYDLEDYNRWMQRFEEEEELPAEGGREFTVSQQQAQPQFPQPQPQSEDQPPPRPRIASPNPFEVLNQNQEPEPQQVDELRNSPPLRSPSPPRSPSPVPPPPPPAPEPRRSERLAGKQPSHYVPLAGAPENTPDQALRLTLTDSSPPKPSSPLALAMLDLELHHDSEAIACATFDLDSNSTPLEFDLALNLALSTSPAWTGSYDSPTYNQIRGRPDYDKWHEAMLAELAAFEATGTWEEELVDLPKERRAISVKWVLLIKRDSEGRILKYKARLVARGDQQIDGVDFDETHSSTVRLTSVRLILALLAANPDWGWAQFDISNAYLLGVLDREIYVKQAPGFSDPSKPKAVRRLKKALYGLKQGGREWQKVLRGALEKVGFKRLDADHGMYVRRREGKVLIVPTHVDDGLIVGDDDIDKALDDISSQLEGKLKKVETGLFLGMKISRFPDGSIDVSQAHYLRNVLDRFFPDGLSPVLTPLDSSYTSITAATEDERFDCPYRELLGALVYLSSCTRPDLAFSLSFVSRFASCPAKRHWTALKHICRYLSGTLDHGLRYLTPTVPFSSSLVSGWSDADHGADKDTRRSVSGYVFNVGEDSLLSTAISWLSRRQKSVAISSCEAEYMAFSEAGREALWLRQLLRELGFPTPSPTLIRGDNTGSLLLASHPTSHSRTKHIDIHYHFTRDLVTEGKVILKWVPTADMVADVFTKGLGREKHFFFRRRCGLMDLRREGGCEKVEKVRSEDEKGEKGT